MFCRKKELGKNVGGAALNLPKIRKNPPREIIAINTGYVHVLSIVVLAEVIVVYRENLYCLTIRKGKKYFFLY